MPTDTHLGAVRDGDGPSAPALPSNRQHRLLLFSCTKQLLNQLGRKHDLLNVTLVSRGPSVGSPTHHKTSRSLLNAR